jgi:hypothetical protein
MQTHVFAQPLARSGVIPEPTVISGKKITAFSLDERRPPQAVVAWLGQYVRAPPTLLGYQNQSLTGRFV